MDHRTNLGWIYDDIMEQLSNKHPDLTEKQIEKKYKNIINDLQYALDRHNIQLLYRTLELMFSRRILR